MTFELKIVRKFGHLDGIKEPVRLLDQADQLAFLERELPVLGLDYYLRLYQAFAGTPAYPWGDLACQG